LAIKVETKNSFILAQFYINLGAVWIARPCSRFQLCAFSNFFFFFRAGFVDFSTVNSVLVHYSRTHKHYFFVTFSLKMGSTVLFTRLKIILLQCFQFSVQQNKLYPNRPLISRLDFVWVQLLLREGWKIIANCPNNY